MEIVFSIRKRYMMPVFSFSNYAFVFLIALLTIYVFSHMSHSQTFFCILFPIFGGSLLTGLSLTITGKIN